MNPQPAAPTASSAAATSSTGNLRVAEFTALPSPEEILGELPLSDGAARTVARARDEVRAIMDGLDDRLLVIVGPCSIHDPEAGLDYARRLAGVARGHREDLLVVMRTYFEKPRTTVGWKGLINDPHLDGSHDIPGGLRTARRFLLDVLALGLPTATEFLEPISPQYTADAIVWGAIGARTTESQIHRQLVSGLSMPVGFKNGTDGGLGVAVDACGAAAAAQAFLGIDDAGRAALVETAGNPDTHLILRGGSAGPNYGAEHVAAASARMAGKGLNPRLIVDASHANSGKDHHRQAEVALEIGAELAAGAEAAGAVAGVMLESFLVGGAQPLDVAEFAAGRAQLVYGQSVTDKCMEWGVTEQVLDQLAGAVRARRVPKGHSSN
ncbi:Phospho-2-dehydro-3-deoxyheptonate aldolase [Sinomonas atrocyanea]|uniref:Phospho-2-dehydro-3-deoxyheptonate aldolase n=1 Tax=Sinomonas atrocyanea TaxID=37927 RepID=A0A127A8C7_9MICC|nr:3-deoxy-7-phosphoheptulonate synthase [Sinomonas atrocyanea]AMM33922.1 Phospho-2-dehydro-3-deoxyheptonate aldolase [Sinomonas atrocyanea]GEB63458.1 phospho-2-dehydro-3-deoxyheptonate aldolase [Sinomonas atrocyanea]GGG56331.1 phospho-2-dehydro-3-deoxyheptonate aldolase [Sinomonas atrocyanea]